MRLIQFSMWVMGGGGADNPPPPPWIMGRENCPWNCLAPRKKTLTVCPGNSDPFNLVSYYIKWVTTSWTHSNTIENISRHQLGCLGKSLKLIETTQMVDKIFLIIIFTSLIGYRRRKK